MTDNELEILFKEISMFQQQIDEMLKDQERYLKKQTLEAVMVLRRKILHRVAKIKAMGKGYDIIRVWGVWSSEINGSNVSRKIQAKAVYVNVSPDIARIILDNEVKAVYPRANRIFMSYVKEGSGIVNFH